MKKIISAFLTVVILFTMVPQYILAKEAGEVSVVPGKNNAYVVFGETIESRKMTFLDGMADKELPANDPLYNEKVNLDGIPARKVYKENYVYLKLDESYYQKGDNKFLVLITYYDFGPDIGYFHFEYNSSSTKSDGSVEDYKRISVMKKGIVPKWCSVRLMIEDADFGGKMEHGMDMRLVSNAYNAFAKIELINISAAERSGDNVEIGTVNTIQAESLGMLDLFEGKNGEAANVGLEEKMTRGEALCAMLKASGKDSEISLSDRSSFIDVPSDLQPYVAYAEKTGITKGSGDGLFNPDKTATVRDLLMFYFRLLGVQGDNLYENAYSKAYEIKLILGSDVILSETRDLTRDNFAAIAYNALFIKSFRTEHELIEEVMRAGKITGNDLVNTGIPELVAYKYCIPMEIPVTTVYDEVAKRDIHYMNIDGGRAIRTYITQQCWDSTGTKFVVGHDKTASMYEFNTETNELKFLDYAQTSGALNAFVTPNDEIFYINHSREIYKMNWRTYQKEKVADFPSGVNSGDFLEVTNDGKYLTCVWRETKSELDFVNGAQRIRIIPRLNCETGEWDTSLHKEFTEPVGSYDVGHPVINPVYENLIFFCHEGLAQNIHDRLWLGDVDTGKSFNLFEQAVKMNGRTGEASGHENWSLDGEDMFFVKYSSLRDQNVGQSGLVRISKDGKEREYLNDDYNYWHCYPSGDKNWVVGDTQQDGYSEVILVNAKTYQSQIISRFRMWSNVHPYQAHPIISYNGKNVGWGMVDDNNVLCAAWADTSEFTDKGVTGGSEKFNEQINVVSYADSYGETEKSEYNGTKCIRAAKGKGIYFDISDSIIKEKNADITLKITYLDSGVQPIVLNYTSAEISKKDLANRENKSVTIKRGGTDEWKTAEIRIDKANVANAGKFMTDFTLCGVLSEVCVSDIELIIR